MSNFIAIAPTLGNPSPVSLTNTSQMFPVGQTIMCEDRGSGASSVNRGAGEFVYLRGSNVTTIGQFVHISNGSAVLLASANSGSFFPIGVAAGVLSASNVFGWVQIAGACDVAIGTNSSVAAGVPLYLAATAGVLISTPGAGSKVQGVCAIASFTSSQSSMIVQLNRPQVLGASAGL